MRGADFDGSDLHPRHPKANAREKQAAKKILHKAGPAMAAAVAKTKFAKAIFLAAARQREQLRVCSVASSNSQEPVVTLQEATRLYVEVTKTVKED